MAKRAKVTIEIDVELVDGYERDGDVKASICDAVSEWKRREWQIHGRQAGQHGPGYPPESCSGDVVPLMFSDEHPKLAGKQWGTMKATWEVVKG